MSLNKCWLFCFATIISIWKFLHFEGQWSCWALAAESWTGRFQLQTSRYPHLLSCALWRGFECRSPQVTDKARWKGRFCAPVWKKCTRLKIARPPVKASPLKTAGSGSCLHSATWKLILSLCHYLVPTPPLLPLFVDCFVRVPSRRQSQPNKKSSFWIHWSGMNTGNFPYCSTVHKLVLTHRALSIYLKRFFMKHFLLLPLDTFCEFNHVGSLIILSWSC